MPTDVSSLPTDRAGRQRWIRRQEARVATLVRARLRGVVVGAYERFTDSLTAAGDLTILDDIPHAWLTAVYTDIAPALEEIYLSGAATAWLGIGADPASLLSQAFMRVTNENAVSYMAGATSRLSGVGQNAWQLIRAKTVTAIQTGAGTEHLKQQIESVTQFSEFRADTIARTETNAAYVQGDMAGARALGDDGPVMKTWVAVQDARTRDDHSDADGQTVPIGGLFDVGDEQLDSPHDPSASAGNSVNCRCYVEFLYAGDTAPDGSTVEDTGPAVPGSISIDDDEGD